MKIPAKVAGIEMLLNSSSPLGVQVRERLREAIRFAGLPRGTRLPASRDLARRLGVSRNTVLFAYEELLAEQWLSARVGSGTRVRTSGKMASGCDPDGTVLRFLG